jgi:sarcosine oxidase gamma subunit
MPVDQHFTLAAVVVTIVAHVNGVVWKLRDSDPRFRLAVMQSYSDAFHAHLLAAAQCYGLSCVRDVCDILTF